MSLNKKIYHHEVIPIIAPDHLLQRYKKNYMH